MSVTRRLRWFLGSVKRRLRRFGRIARARVRYRRNRRRHLALYVPDASRAPDPQVVESLVQDGATVVRSFLATDAVRRIATEVEASAEAVARGRYSGPLKTMVGDEGGLFRLYEIERSLSPSSCDFFESSFIAGTADSMCRVGMHSADRYLEIKSDHGRDKTVGYHIDHWKLRFKAYLLLRDVTEAQAPFVYVLGSHRQQPWRRKWDWGYHHRGVQGGSLSPEDVRTICRRYGFEERTFTGNAGDLILADTRGIHRGNLLQSGVRWQLVNLFKMNGPDDYAC